MTDLDLPIALRKPTRACGPYQIQDFIYYGNLSTSYKAFVSQVDQVTIPESIQEEMKSPKWRQAENEEIKALEKNNTWSITELPKGKKTVGCRWLVTMKYKSDGSIERYKSRLVAKGYTQSYGIDYQETFAPVAKLNTVRVLMSIASNLDWPLFQLDVKNAFFNGIIEEEVYMALPPGFEDERSRDKVCRLHKSLYGLKQSPRAWFGRFTRVLKDCGYKQGHADHTLFTKHSNQGRCTILSVYVNDIILTGDDQDEINKLKKVLAAEFEVKDLG